MTNILTLRLASPVVFETKNKNKQMANGEELDRQHKGNSVISNLQCVDMLADINLSTEVQEHDGLIFGAVFLIVCVLSQSTGL